MEENMFSGNLADLYAMQRLVQEREQAGMRLVGMAQDATNVTKNDLHFFASVHHMIQDAMEKGREGTMVVVNMADFQHVLNHETRQAEDKLQQPLEQLIRQINTDWQMSPAITHRYFQKVFQQETQAQMGHDLGHVYTHLLTEQQQGKEWVAYPDIEKVGKGDLRTFTTKDEAQQFVNDHSNVAVMYDYHAIGRILDALTPLVAAAIDKSFGKDQDHNHKRDNNKDQDSELER